jgi:hypothetical protein
MIMKILQHQQTLPQEVTIYEKTLGQAFSQVVIDIFTFVISQAVTKSFLAIKSKLKTFCLVND